MEKNFQKILELFPEFQVRTQSQKFLEKFWLSDKEFTNDWETVKEIISPLLVFCIAYAAWASPTKTTNYNVNKLSYCQWQYTDDEPVSPEDTGSSAIIDQLTYHYTVNVNSC